MNGRNQWFPATLRSVDTPNHPGRRKRARSRRMARAESVKSAVCLLSSVFGL